MTAGRRSGRDAAASRSLRPAGRVRRFLALAAATATAAASAILTAPVAAAAPAPQSAPVVAQSGPAPLLMHDPDVEYKILVFSKTGAFRHTAGIDAGKATIADLGAEHGFTADFSEDSSVFTTENLEQYKTVVFLSTTGNDILNTDEKAAFEQYIQAGGGYFGVHAASDTEYNWNWYGDLVGAYFQGHPAGTPNGSIIIEDRSHPMTAGLDDTITIDEEWYNFRSNPRANVHVLVDADTTSYSGSTMPTDHPLAWCHDYDGGRAAYTALGHDATNWSSDWFQQMITGGIETTAGVVDADCGASLAKEYEVVSLDDNTADPMMLDVAADGSVFYIQQGGQLRVIDPNTNLTSTVATLPVFTANESGLLGLALHPDFATNHQLFLFHSPVGEDVDRLSRFTYDPATKTLVADSAVAVLDVPVQRAECCHHGGSMVFDPNNGDLYLATGDNSNPFASNGYAPVDYRSGRDFWDSSRTSGNTNSLSGKVLRIHPEDDGSYTVPGGNLFTPGTDKTKAEIYAMGLRNPFRINIDPQTGRLFVADYGPDAGSADPARGPENTVEWNIVDQPGFYGWPFCTGDNAAYHRWDFASNTGGTAYECATGVVNDSPHNTGLTELPPAIPADIFYHYNAGTDWPEIGGGGAPMAGPMYRFDEDNASATKWPAYWDGKALLGEWNKNTMFSILTDTAVEKVLKATVTTVHTLPAPADRSIKMMDAKFGPDGSLYLIDWGGGWSNNADSGIYRIDYLAGDRAPVAKASADVTDGSSPLTVAFSSEGSADPDGSAVTFAWNFGDGTTSDEPNPAHTFDAGVYDVQLVVSDEGGRTGISNLQIVSGNNRPVVAVQEPLDGQFFEFGDQIRYTATVTDAEDGSTEAGTIDCDLVLEQSQLGHFSGGSAHAHPMGETNGCTATIQTLGDGGHGGDVWLYWVIEISYTDQGNGDIPPLTGTTSVVLQTKHRQAEHFNDTGRISTSTAGGDPGVEIETTSDPAGGTQNIGFIEDGDWISFDKTNLKDITDLSMRVAGTTGAAFEVRWNDPESGTLLGTVPAAPTSGWQDFTETSTVLTDVTDETGTLYLVAANDSATGSLVNVNWVDFSGKGATLNQRPEITEASVTPLTGTAPLEVQLSAAAVDPEGEDVTYEWNMGTASGDTVSGAEGSFVYTAAGTYNLTLTATDARGAFHTKTFQVKVSGAPPSCLGAKSDEFDGDSLDESRWEVIRPDGELTVADGAVVIPTAPADIYAGTNNAPNIVLQDLPDGAWQATTKVSGAVYTAYQQAGLVVYGDDDNYAKLVFSGRSSSGDKAARIVQYAQETAAAPLEANSASLGADFPDTVWLRLTSDGTSLTPSYSVDGAEWIDLDTAAVPTTHDFTDPRIGLIALANTGEPVDASFDFFYLTPDETTDVGPNDDFDGPAVVDCRWQVIRPNPQTLTFDDGWLALTTAAGEPSAAENVLQQPQPDGNNWVVETRIDAADFVGGYQQAGLIAYLDESNFVKIDYVRDSDSNGRVELRSTVDGTFVDPQPEFASPDTDWYLRLERQDNNFVGYYSADGQDWTQLADPVANIPVASDGTVGVFAAGVQQTESATARFDYFTVVGSDPGPDTTAPVTTAEVSDADPAIVTLTATDDGGSGVALTEYRINTQTWSTYTEPISVERTATAQSVEFRSTDEAGNVEDTRSVEVPAAEDPTDETAPELTLTLDPATPDGSNDWYKQSVTVAAEATDEVDPEPSIQVRIGDGDWSDYTGPVELTDDGQVELVFRAVDAAGNSSDEVTRTVKVDRTKPVAVLSDPPAPAFQPGTVLNFSATDAQGLARIVANIYRDGVLFKSTQKAAGGATSVEHSVDTKGLADGAYTIRYNAHDLAGWVAQTRTFDFVVDSVAPVTTAKVSGTAANRKVTITATDAGSGVQQISYRLNAGEWTDYTGPITVDAKNHVLWHRATDAAGNVGKAVVTTLNTASNSGPKVSLNARSQCVGGKAAVAVWAQNSSGVKVDIRMTTPFGTEKFSAVAAGAAVHHVFGTGSAEVVAGTATVAAYSYVNGVGSYGTTTLNYQAESCG